MVTQTPQWTYGRFVPLDTIPIMVFVIVAAVLAMGWLLCRRTLVETPDSCNCNCLGRFRDWFFKKVVKPVTLDAFKGTMQEGCENAESTTTCCHCTHTKRLKFGDVYVEVNKQSTTIDFFFVIFYVTLLFVVIVFWDAFLFNVTVGVDCIPGQACFLDSNLSLSSPPMDCDSGTRQTDCGCDVSPANSTVVYCNELALDYALAGGIASGLFKLTTLIIRITFLLFLWVWKKSSFAVTILQMVLSVLVGVAVICLAFIPVFADIIFNGTVIRAAQFFVGYMSFGLVLVFPFSWRLEERQQGDPSAALMTHVDASDNYVTTT